ncbi:MAG: aryl-sulfate sulfotransferase [Nannocystaceae bacterium]|nr:aryl-sulfate sulfotransferase [Myxococcales bacterium]
MAPAGRDVRLMALLLTCVACSGDAGETEAGTDAPTSEPVALAYEADPEVILYPAQPMVVDVALALTRPGAVTIEHASDDGVRSGRIDDEADAPSASPWVRVRGLLPDAEHTLRITVVGDDGEALPERLVTLRTPPPLPGFVAAFEVEGEIVGAAPALRLFDLIELPTPARSSVFMVDREGRTRWHASAPVHATWAEGVAAGVSLRGDGTLSFVREGEFYVIDELGAVTSHVTPAQLDVPWLHHDVIELPSGRFLALAWVFRDVEYPDEGALRVAGDRLVEFDADGEVYWTWDSFDHLDPQRRRDGFELLIPGFDGGAPAQDWTHANGVIHDPRDDSVLVSMRHQDWILKIDRASGAIAWRLGMEGDLSLEPSGPEGEVRWFCHQHSPQWQPDGTLLVYDNGVGNPDIPDEEETSRAVGYAIDEEAMTARVAWVDDEPAFVSALGGDVERMPGGHLLVLDSLYFDGDIRPRLRELDAAGARRWALHLPPGRFAYRATAWARLVGEVSL